MIGMDLLGRIGRLGGTVGPDYGAGPYHGLARDVARMGIKALLRPIAGHGSCAIGSPAMLDSVAMLEVGMAV